jgi:D-glycerate 3-kinase
MFKQNNKSNYMHSSQPDSLSHRLRFEVEHTLASLYAARSLIDQLDCLYFRFSYWLD